MMPHPAASSLDGVAYLSFVTFRRSGTGVPAPIWFAEVGDAYYAFSARDAGKIKRLRHTARVRIAPCDMAGRPRGAWLETRAHLVDDPQEEIRAYAALRAKYGWQMRITDFFSSLSGRIHRRRLIRIERPAPEPAVV